MPDFIQQWRSNPASPLPTIRCKPWHYEDKLVLIGDAAHAVVPFYGQGRFFVRSPKSQLLVLWPLADSIFVSSVRLSRDELRLRGLPHPG